MSYIEKRLYDGEIICHRGEFHWLHKWGAWFALFGLGIFLIGIYVWAKLMIKFATVEFVVTNRRVVLKKGFLSARMDELELDAIEGGHVRQSVLGRMFGYGDVHYTGRGTYTLDLPVMAHPGQFVAQADKARANTEAEPFDHLVSEIHEETQMARQQAAREAFRLTDKPLSPRFGPSGKQFG